MKKSLRQYLFYGIVFVFCVAGAFSYGFISSQFMYFPYVPIKYLYNQFNIRKYRIYYILGIEEKGRWRRAKLQKVNGMSLKDREAISRLAALPYLQGHFPAPDRVNVTRYQKDRAFNGLNLYVSGHKPSAFLVDMEGKVLHEWKKEMEEVWPEGFDFFELEENKHFWRRAHLYENGDLLAVFDGIGLIKIDCRSNLIWANQCRAHHDVYVHENGSIYTLTRRMTKPSYPGLNIAAPILEDFITILSPNGEIVKSVSIIKCFLNSKYSPSLSFMQGRGDVFHTNTIDVLDGKAEKTVPMFKKGHVMISIRHLNCIAVIDLEEEKVTWALSGMYRFQHQPTVLQNGNLLIFDNIGTPGTSKIIEFNPMTHQIAWEYKGSPDNEFFSDTCGSVMRLPNGNTLITESDRGRAFEVAPDKEIVWEFLNPHRAGEDKELIATLFEVIRFAPGQISCNGGSESGCFEAE